MQVVMTENRAVSLDGSKVTRFRKGKSYDVPEPLAHSWIDAGAASDPNAAPAPVHSKPSAPERRKASQ